MLVKDILKLNLTDELVAQSGYVHSGYRGIENCRKSDVIKVQLVSHTKYEETFYGWETPAMIASDPKMLKPSVQGAKTFKFLVKKIKEDGTEIHALASPKEIWGLWSAVEAQWANANQREAQQQAEQARRYEIEQAVIPNLRRSKDDREARIRQSHAELFGAGSKVSVYTNLEYNWVNAEGKRADLFDSSAVLKHTITGTVDIPVDLYEQLIEELLTYRIDYA